MQLLFELVGCTESLSTEIVKQELGDAENIVCITQHPGFKPVCLERWSLRMAAWNYKTKGNERYRNRLMKNGKLSTMLFVFSSFS